MNTSKVTVYITSHNYGRFLDQAIKSVLNQSYLNWECIIFDDNSTDNTNKILDNYREDVRINIVSFSKRMGLRYCANKALELAKGDYIIRLDADDYFDENAFKLMVGYLQENLNVALVYSDWIYIDEFGGFLGKETRRKVGSEIKVNDLSIHGACTMVRTEILKSLGGYSIDVETQDGFELWLKVIQNYPIGSISTPLFYYRKHGPSMSSSLEKLLNARRKIKSNVINKNEQELNCIAVVPIRNISPILPNIAFTRIKNETLLDKTISDIIESKLFTQIIIDSDDFAVTEYVNKTYPSIFTSNRNETLLGDNIRMSKVVFEAIQNFIQEKGKFDFDIISILPIHCPFRDKNDIIEGYHTLLLTGLDQVISVYSDFDLHFMHSLNGLIPINPSSIDSVRYERENLYVSNGAVHFFWKEQLHENSLYTGKIGHFEMTKEKSFQIKKIDDLKLINIYE